MDLKSDTKNVKSLGSGHTEYELNKPKPELLETFDNQHPDSNYVIPIECFEFSSLCPKTGQPDFGTIYINYVPNELCVESKSLKLYLFSLRNHGEFMEDLTNRLMKELKTLLNPRYIEVYSRFNSRGGIALTPVAISWSDEGKSNYDDIAFNVHRTAILTNK